MSHSVRKEQRKRFVDFLLRAQESTKHARTEGTAPTLEAVKRRQRLTASQLLGSYKPAATVVWRTFLIPTEILYATGAIPLTPEIVCAALSPNQQAISRLLEQAEELGHDPKQCSFLKTTIAAMHEGLLPTPDLVIGSVSYCSGVGSILREAADYFGRPFVYLNLPLYSGTPQDIEYVARQLREFIPRLCEHTGISVEEVERDTLPKAIEFSNKASRYWDEVKRLRQHIPSPMTGREAIDFASVLAQTWGSEKIVDVYRLLRDEVKERIQKGVASIPHETVRLGWLHLRPYYSTEIFRWLEEAGAAVVYEEVNYPSRLNLDPHDPYRSLAREILFNSGRYRAFSPEWEQDLREAARDYKVDGVIHFSHENCGWVETVFPPVKRFLRDKLNLPLLSLSGDCLVKHREKLLNTRVQAFVEGLIARKHYTPGEVFAYCDNVPPSHVRNQRYFVGADVGSSSTKVVVLDSARRVKAYKIFPTGPDNKKTVQRALRDALNQAEKIRFADIKRIVATGVGRGNVPFEHAEVTEVTCHVRGALYRVSDARTVVDIGGQDIKVMLVRERMSRLNDSCAAGTGKFLEAIAKALDIELDELTNVDEGALQAIPINKMCTVFAESEVVDRVGDGANVSEIVRGVHEMVASKATTLLRWLSKDVTFPVVFSGGVAMNGGVVRALERSIGGDVVVPDYPQIIGALGAALIASDGF